LGAHIGQFVNGEVDDRRIVAEKNRIAQLDRAGAIISNLEEVDDCTPVGGHRVDVAHRLSPGFFQYGSLRACKAYIRRQMVRRSRTQALQ
jgi:hypothetical protein